ncbi:MAG: hypothetical protein A2283_13985 [Lentisphaerae bacterium RIFOXYA12_FULL_48_11]|nr:MAG: hypothetical protein A2283_13985 [Lentisphaerae bacterium RIFOXYA12_FULL_48_11]
MKARPTREQNKYLSIVLDTPEENLPRPPDEDPIIPAAGLSKKKARASSKKIGTPRSLLVRSSEFPAPVIIILIVIALLMALIRGVHGAEDKLLYTATNVLPVVLNNSNTTTKPFPAVNPPLSKTGNVSSTNIFPHRKRATLSMGKSALHVVSNNLISTTTISFLPNCPAGISNVDKKVRESEFSGEYETISGEAMSLWGLFAITVIIGLVISPWLLRRLYIWKRKTISGKKAGERIAGSIPGDVDQISIPEKSEETTVPILDKSDVKYENPEKILKDIIEHKEPFFPPVVSLPSRLWDVAVASNKGNVRTRNEDSGIAFLCFGIQFLVIADGLGGMKHGQIASNSAVCEVIRSIVSDITHFGTWHRADVLAIIEKAMYRAAIRLSEEAAKLHLSHPQEGLRTTLIIIAGGLDYYAYVYIGDGGGLILRSDGSSEQFLNPQKADERFANILAASLGPYIEGKPRSGTSDRFPGDLLIAGSDGVFDYIVPEFSLEVAKKVFELNGNLQEAAENIVEILADEKDEKGFLCSDNLTLGLMANAPVLPLMFSELNKVCETTVSAGKKPDTKEF